MGCHRKTEVIHSSRAKKLKEYKSLVSIRFQGDTLECKTSLKYLGVIFDKSLNWEAQANLMPIKRLSSISAK